MMVFAAERRQLVTGLVCLLWVGAGLTSRGCAETPRWAS